MALGSSLMQTGPVSISQQPTLINSTALLALALQTDLLLPPHPRWILLTQEL